MSALGQKLPRRLAAAMSASLPITDTTASGHRVRYGPEGDVATLLARSNTIRLSTKCQFNEQQT